MESVRALPYPTLVQAVSPKAGEGIRLAEAVAMSVFIGLCAQIQVFLPGTPVPLTGQTLAVLLSGALLGSRWGAAAVVAYLMEGSLGMPFFAGGAFGAAHLVGPSGGYLLGFLPAAWLTGRLAQRGWDRTPVKAAAMMALGSLVILACGTAGLSRFVPAGGLLAAGVLPFLPGDAVKIVLAASALPFGWSVLGRFGSPSKGR